MNRLTTAVVATVLLLALVAGGSLVYLAYTGRQEASRREESLRTQSKFGDSLKTTSPYGAKLLIETGPVTQHVPVTLAFRVTSDPSGKGITGLKAVLVYNPKVFSLAAEAVKETLPSPWKYVRKEVSGDGKIVLEAIYLQAGASGYQGAGQQKLATLNFSRRGQGNFSLQLDQQKSLIFFKENNASIPLTYEGVR